MCCLYRTYMSESNGHFDRSSSLIVPETTTTAGFTSKHLASAGWQKKNTLQSSTPTERDSTIHRQKLQLVHTCPAKRRTVTTQFLRLRGRGGEE